MYTGYNKKVWNKMLMKKFREYLWHMSKHTLFV